MLNIGIEFEDNGYGTVFAGQAVKGKVIAKLDRPQHFNEITIRITGFAKTKWTEGHSWIRLKHCIYEASEEYINDMICLARPAGIVDEHLTLQSGTHFYNFECYIPADCPTSFESKYGFVRYLAKATFVNNDRGSQTHIEAFTVLKMLDLNDSWALLVNSAYKDITYKTKWGTAPPLTLSSEIPQSGYVAGEYIPVLVRLNTKSSLKIKNVTISLLLLATFTSTHPLPKTLTRRISLVSKSSGPFVVKGLHQMTEHLRIPPTLPTSRNDSKIVSIEYEIHVKATLGGLRSKAMVVTPVTIGIKKLQHRPIVNVERDSIGGETSVEMRNFGLYPLRLDSTISTTSSEDCPPRYEEALYMDRVDVTEDEYHGIKRPSFLPKYPFVESTEFLNID